MSTEIRYISVDVDCYTNLRKPAKIRRTFLLSEPVTENWTETCDHAMKEAVEHAQKTCGFPPNGGRWTAFEAMEARKVTLPYEITPSKK